MDQFINKAAGRDVAVVGDGPQRCTSDVQPFIFKQNEDPARRVIFIDTPGFNSDTIGLDDKMILKQILDWLQTS
jgi:GTPase Era involved in 16S rRNA processing